VAKRVARKVGNVLSILLPDGDHGYGFELRPPLVVVVNYKDKKDLPAQEVVQIEPLFKVYVVDSAIKSGRWPVVGNVELAESWLQPQKFYRQDALDPSQLFIRTSDGVETPTDIQGIQGLEKAAVWAAEHVEGRIQDHFAGRPNLALKALQLRPISKG
jgi:Immunity protein 26